MLAWPLASLVFASPAAARGARARRAAALAPGDCAHSTPTMLLEELTAAPAYKREEPPAAGSAVVVEQQVAVEKLLGVNERQGTFTVAGYWRSSWVDPRLAFNGTETGGCFDSLPISLRGDLKGPPSQDKVWMPAMFFENALEEVYSTYDFRLYPSGRLLQSNRIKHTFSCSMDLTRQPFDSQICSIKLMSYDQHADRVRLRAKDGVPVELLGQGHGASKVQTTVWSITDTFSETTDVPFGSGEDAMVFEELNIQLQLHRKPLIYLKKDVLYAVMFVTISYVGFWVDGKVVPARAALAVIPVLTMLNHIHGVEATLPPLAHFTWLSTFLTISLLYTFIAVLELCAVSFFLRVEEYRRRRLLSFQKLTKRMSDPKYKLTNRESKLEQEALHMVDSSPLGRLTGRGDGDGLVTVSELRKGLRKFDAYYSQEECRELLFMAKAYHREQQRSSAGGDASKGPAGEACAGDAKSAALRSAAAASSESRRQGAVSDSGAGRHQRTRLSCRDLTLSCLGGSPPAPSVDRAEEQSRVQIEVGTDTCRGEDSRTSVRTEDSEEEEPTLKEEEFRTFLVSHLMGEISTAPPTHQSFWDKPPSIQVDMVARLTFMPSYLAIVVIMVMIPHFYEDP